MIIIGSRFVFIEADMIQGIKDKRQGSTVSSHSLRRSQKFSYKVGNNLGRN